MTIPPNQQPGWYPDHHDPRLLRWWDGSSWSYHVKPRPGALPEGQRNGVGRGRVAGVLGAAGLILIVVAVMLGGVVASVVGGGESQEARSKPQRQLVTRVVDGDTVELANGEHVRLLGIDTPEVGVCGFKESSAAMRRLVEGERVVLTRAGDDRDRYDRLLRYVDVHGTDAGLRLIERGLAVARYDSRDGYGAHPREAAYIRADRKAPDLTCE